MELLPLALAAPLLLWIAWTDFWVMRIRNGAVHKTKQLPIVAHLRARGERQTEHRNK